jgi:alkylation response protein AidB-like acyl-CoA dehydrogenase
MDFGFTEEQREVQALARQILSEQVTTEKLAAYDEYAAPRMDRDLWGQLLEAGLPNIAVAEAYGGMGFGFMELALLLEEAGRTIAPVPLTQHCVSAMMPIQRFAPDALKEQVLPAATRGELLLTAAMIEHLNEDPATPVSTTAVPDGDSLILNGSKSAVPYAAEADRILVAAALDGDVAVVLVDRNATGVVLTPVQSTAFEPQYDLTLNNVRVDDEAIVVRSGGAAVMAWGAQRTIAALCAHQLGATDFAMRLSASYTSERQQFGVPVATFQAVGHRMADCYIDIECLRLTTYQAASLLHSEAEAATELAIAKIWAGDCGHRVSYAAQHVHGGTGIDRDYSLWRYCLWLRHNEMTLGGSTVHIAALGREIAAGGGLFS